jgi:hypothetical protein
VLYQPLFALTWYHDLPPFWTMFLPYYDRSCFTDDEMSLVDQRWPQMNAYLTNFNNDLLRPTGDGLIEMEDFPGNLQNADGQPANPVVGQGQV